MNPNHDLDKRTDPAFSVVENAGAGDATVIPVIEEQLLVEKQVVDTGRLLVNKTVREEEQVVTTPLSHDEITVERVSLNQYVETAPAVWYEGDLTVVPVVKEVLVLEKRLMLVEEVHITKRRVTTDETQRVMLRREEVTVERISNEADARPDVRSSL